MKILKVYIKSSYANLCLDKSQSQRLMRIEQKLGVRFLQGYARNVPYPKFSYLKGLLAVKCSEVGCVVGFTTGFDFEKIPLLGSDERLLCFNIVVHSGSFAKLYPVIRGVFHALNLEVDIITTDSSETCYFHACSTQDRVEVMLSFFTPYRSKVCGRLITPQSKCNDLLKDFSFRFKLELDVVAVDFAWRQYIRFSNRQQQRMFFGGVIGDLQIRVPRRSCGELVRLGREGIGKLTNLGFGRFTVKCATNVLKENKS